MRADRLNAWPVRLRMCRMFGSRAWWSVVPNADELARRDAHPVRAIKRLDVAAVLLSLPMNLPVPEDSLRPKELRLLSSLPSCLVERVDGAVVRRTSSPVTVDHVVLPTKTFRPGLEAVTEFSTYCARSMVIPAGTDLTEIELAEASYYGVGIYRADGDSLLELVAPEPMDGWPETPASWIFAETLWDELGPLGCS